MIIRIVCCFELPIQDYEYETDFRTISDHETVHSGAAGSCHENDRF